MEVNKVSYAVRPLVAFKATDSSLASLPSFVKTQSEQSSNRSDPNGRSADASIILLPSPSMSVRETTYDNNHEQSPSTESFKFSFPSEPSPDQKTIVDDAKQSQSLRTCANEVPELTQQLPSSIITDTRPPSPLPLQLPEPKPAPSPTSAPSVSPMGTPFGMVCTNDWDSYIEMLDESKKPFAKPEKSAGEQFVVDVRVVMPICESDEELIEQEDVVRVKAVCVTHRDSVSSSSSESVITFPVEINAQQNSNLNSVAGNAKDDMMHGGLPVFSVENAALDTSMAIRSALNCPVEYISKEPPLLALENYCFVIDGDLIDVEKITEHSKWWWKETSSNVRYYFSVEMKTFYQVDALLCRGELRCAFMRKRRASGIEPVPLEKLFRVSRIYSHWKTCNSFHRIISDISPVTDAGLQFFGFRKRIFVQYLWRTEKRAEKKRVAQEYKMAKIPVASAGKGRRSSLSSAAVVGQRRQTICRTLNFDRRPSLEKPDSPVLGRRFSINRLTEKVDRNRPPSRIPLIQKSTSSMGQKVRQARKLPQLDSLPDRYHQRSLIPQLKNSAVGSIRRVSTALRVATPLSSGVGRPISLVELRERIEKRRPKLNAARKNLSN